MISPKFFWRWALGIFFIVAGSFHFLNPRPYLSMMPPYLPWPETLVWVSGVAEMLGGVGILLPQVRRFAGWGLMALLIAVFPANLHVALHGWPGVNLPQWVLWMRLPFQVGFMWWVYSVSIRQDKKIA